MAFFANIFGYLLNFIYNIIGNYGWTIIVFTIVIKLLMLPISIKQQKAIKLTAIFGLSSPEDEAPFTLTPHFGQISACSDI